MPKYMIVNGTFYKVDEALIHQAKPNTKPREEHKYTRREWKDDKWMYYYDKPVSAKNDAAETRQPTKLDSIKKKITDFFNNPFGIRDRQEYKDAERWLSDAKKMTDSAKTAYDTVRDNAYADNHLTNLEKLTINVTKTAHSESAKKYVKAGEDYVKEREEYLNTPLGKLEQFGTDVKNFFKGIFGIKKEEKPDDDKLNEEELARQKKGEYVEAQTEERNGVRTKELEALTEKYNEPETWLENLFGIDNNPLSNLPLKQNATTLDDDMALVNPNYHTEKNRFDENCGACSIAYDLRRRGYDVEVVSEGVWMGYGGTLDDIMDCYEGAKLVTSEDILKKKKRKGESGSLDDAMTRDILSHGEGARGIMTFEWFMGGGHAISWEVENGEVVYRDCQNNQKINLSDYSSKSRRETYIRTDNLKPTEKCYRYVIKREG